MVINSLFRITGPRKIVDVDEGSTSPRNATSQVLLFEKAIPDHDTIFKFTENTSTGTIIAFDTFDKNTINVFDNITGAESNLLVIKIIELDSIKAILCIPDDFLTLFIGQNLNHEQKTFQIKIITLSDRAHRGIYKDLSGPKATEIINNHFIASNKKVKIKNIIIPDSAEELSMIFDASKLDKTDIIITTGGTGIGKRDITIETVQKFIEKEIPGIMEMIRLKYGSEKPNALLSRAIAGTMKNTLVYTLPGSVKAVEEYLTEILKTLNHLLYMLHGIDNH